MTKFIFKSNASDLQKISQSLETIQKNVLYCTFRIDLIVKKLNSLGLEQQTLDYYGKKYGEELGSVLETSPQTDPGEQN